MSGNKGGVLLSRVFGDSSQGDCKMKTAQTRQEIIQQLRDVEDVLNKKKSNIQKQKSMKNALKRKKRVISKRNGTNQFIKSS